VRVQMPGELEKRHLHRRSQSTQRWTVAFAELSSKGEGLRCEQETGCKPILHCVGVRCPELQMKIGFL
jgi:hypothetical protein